MENTTGPSPEPPVKRTHQPSLWILDIAIVSVSAVTSLYVLLALITHGVMKSKERNRKERVRPLREKRLATFTKAISAFVAFLSLFYNCMRVWILVLQYDAVHSIPVPQWTQDLCHKLPRLTEFIVSIAMGLCYLFLWARQSVFYLNPSLAALNNVRVKFFSYSVVIFWVLYYIPVATVQTILVHYEYVQPGACTIVEESLLVFQKTLISWVVVSCLMQVVLLWLFVNPILNRTSIRGHRSTKNAGQSASYMRIHRRVKRAFILAGVCLASDIVSALVSVMAYRPDSNNVTSIYSINLCINLLATVGCFDDWRGMLFPWCRGGKKQASYQAQSSSVITPSAPGANSTGNVAIGDVSIVSSREI